MEDMKLRLRLFEEVLFELVEGSTEQTFKPKHPKLRRTIIGLITSLARHNSFEEKELYSSAVTIAWEALDSFKLAEGAVWEPVIAGEDKLNLNRVVKAIIAKIEHELPALANPNTKRMYDPETGGKMFVTINFDSLDRPIYGEDDEIIGSVIDEVEESFFAPKKPAVKNPFLEWFRENRHDFLTARQNEFIDGLSTGLLKKDSDYIYENDFAVLAGMPTNDFDHMKKRIKERTLKAWEEQRNGKPELSKRGSYLARRVEEWNEFLAIAESDDNLSEQNARLSEWLKSKDRETGEDAVTFVYDTLASDIQATKAFASFMKGECKSIKASVLYRVHSAVKKEVERLKSEIFALGNATTSTCLSVGPERKALNAERMRKYNEFIKSKPCFHYGSDGQLLRVMGTNLKEYKIMELDAFGVVQDSSK
jgi:hypothetical protein